VPFTYALFSYKLLNSKKVYVIFVFVAVVITFTDFC
jgi:hypothetical protein